MSVVIIGGGISGLSAAWTLAKHNVECTLIEPGPLGGLMRTEKIDGCTVECGADSWIRAKPFLRDLAVELGIGADVIACNEPIRKTFIFRNGKLIRLPRGMRMFVPSEWGPALTSPLFGWGTKFRMIAETLRSPADLGDRTVAEFVRDHFGEEAVEYLAEPLFSGVYGGAPETLGVAAALPKMLADERKIGSLVRAARQEPLVSGPLFESMRSGLGQLIEAIVSAIAPKVKIMRESAEAMEAGRVRVGGDWVTARQVLLACGAPAAARLLGPAGHALAAIPCSSASIVVLSFRCEDVPHPLDGFGFLVPRRERQTIMAATWVNRKFPERAPIGQVLMRCFVSGNHSERILPEVLVDMKRILNITAPPIFTRHYRWPLSLPQFAVGHAAKIAETLAELPINVRIAGSFLGSVGMPDCAKAGAEAARLFIESSDGPLQSPRSTYC